MTRSQTLAILIFAIVSFIPVVTSGQEEPAPLVTLNDVKTGMMLLRTTRPDLYMAAPSVATTVRLQVRGLILRGEVTQQFKNPATTCVEAIYAFPLPDDAAVDRLRMTVGNRIIEGEIHERKQAEKIYEQARAEGKKASLLSQERPNLFTVAIANIAADEEVTVTINYQETIDYEEGTFRLRFPMTIGPRYIPGAPSNQQPPLGPGFTSPTPQVPDANRITPPYNLPGSGRWNHLTLEVDLDAGVPLREVVSSYHRVDTSILSGTQQHLRLSGMDHRSDRDFELVWRPDLGSAPRSALFTEGGAAVAAEGTYALLMMMPPAPSASVRLPREIIFIIDTSGSMAGTSLDGAKQSLLLAIDRVHSNDRFNIIQFNSYTSALYKKPQYGSKDHLDEARAWVRSLESTGGTEMLPALQLALRDMPQENDDMVRQVIFITDGHVGNEPELFALIRSSLGKTRLFTVGIGSAPNSHFMRNAARFGRGTFTYIGNVNEVQAKMGDLFAKVESPVLTNIEVRFDDPAAEMWPARVPDLYAGEPVLVAVRLSRPAGRIVTSGSIGAQQWNQAHQLSITRHEAGIGKLWARWKIESLSDGMDAGAENSAEKQKIIELALAHHLVTQFTSLVAVDKTPAGTPVEACQVQAVPVNLPEGWGGLEGTLPSTATAAQLMLLLGMALIALAVTAYRA